MGTPAKTPEPPPKDLGEMESIPGPTGPVSPSKLPVPDKTETAQFVKVLEANEQVTEGELTPGVTHQLEDGEAVRKRFSAL